MGMMQLFISGYGGSFVPFYLLAPNIGIHQTGGELSASGRIRDELTSVGQHYGEVCEDPAEGSEQVRSLAVHATNLGS